MKITHIIDNLYAGGAQTFVVLLAIEQSKLGHDVSLLIVDKLTANSFESSLINRLEAQKIRVASTNRRLGKNVSVFKSIYTITQYIKKTRPAIINSHLKLSHLLTGIALKMFGAAGTEHIVTLHNAPEIWNRPTYLVNSQKAGIYCSNASLQLSRKRKSRNMVISNGIEKPCLSDSAQDVLKNLGIKADSSIVLCVGKLSAQKNYDLVTQIAERCINDNICFLIAGLKGDSYEKDLANFNRLPNMYFLGTCVPDLIHSLMATCNCFLNTSLHEGLPITVLEAFFIGTPCLLSPIPPHFEIGSQMPGCTIAETFDADEYVRLLKSLFDKAENRSSLMDQRDPLLEEFEINTTARRYLQFYEQNLRSLYDKQDNSAKTS